MAWVQGTRFDPRILPMADRHYSRQKPGTPQFVKPGRCLVLYRPNAYWVTSWPYPEYCDHAWKGAWECAAFRSEGAGLCSQMITEAVAYTRSYYGEVPEHGIITFVHPGKTPGIKVRGKVIHGFVFWKAGWTHVGFTKSGLWVWQQLEDKMPAPHPPLWRQPCLDFAS